MRWLVAIVMLFLFSCENDNSIGEGHVYRVDDSLIWADSLAKRNNDSMRKAAGQPRIRVYLPKKHLDKGEIKKWVEEIDSLRKGDKGEWKMNDFSTDITGCSVEKFFMNGQILYMDMGCGDCSTTMSQEEYYFHDNEVVCLKTHVIQYGYPPCWSEKEYKENGMTAEFRRKNMKKREEVYYLLDSVKLDFKYTGPIFDTVYTSNRPRISVDILDAAMEYLNTENNGSK